MSEDGFKLAESTPTIIGLGLMGGSLALALKKHCRTIYGVDSDQATFDLALSRNIVDRAATAADLAPLLHSADLIILATPVPAILALLQQLPDLMPEACIVLDLGSTKRQIVEAMAQSPDGSIRSAVTRFVAGKNSRLKMQTARYFKLHPLY